MQIAYTSDLHIDSVPANRVAIEIIVDRFVKARPDVVVVAGDAGNTLATVDDALALFRPLECPKFFVAGNHDVWIERTDGRYFDSRAKHETELPAICERHGFHDLDTGPHLVGDVGFAGSLGWYDYSFADPRIDGDDAFYSRGRWDDVIWWDQDMTFWPSADGSERSRLRDAEVCVELTKRFEADVTALEKKAQRIVAVLHCVPFVESIERQDPPYLRDAFTGAQRLGDVLRAHDKIEHCIGAHKHIAGDWTVDGVKYHRRPLGRIQDDESVESAVERSVGFIEV